MSTYSPPIPSNHLFLYYLFIGLRLVLGVTPNPFTVAFRCFHDPNLLLSDNPTLLCDVPERVGGQVKPQIQIN